MAKDFATAVSCAVAGLLGGKSRWRRREEERSATRRDSNLPDHGLLPWCSAQSNLWAKTLDKKVRVEGGIIPELQQRRQSKEYGALCHNRQLEVRVNVM